MPNGEIWREGADLGLQCQTLYLRNRFKVQI